MSVHSSHQESEASEAPETPNNLETRATNASTQSIYPPQAKMLVIFVGLCLVLFLVALDRLIIGVAIPSITNDFHSLNDIGWYGSAYLLTTCAFMLLLGKVYSFASPKAVYLTSLLIFEAGSALSGAAPNSTSFIVGRAIAGLGNAGLFQGAVVIMVYILPLHKRPQYMGIIGAVFGLASVAGPLLGGAFTDGPGWRWCFYINLPIGAVIFGLLFFLLHIPAELRKKGNDTPMTWSQIFWKLDPFGTLVFLPCIACLVLALQWGGITVAWSAPKIIVLLVLAAVLFISFLAIQVWQGENATVPVRIVKNRSIIAGATFSFFGGSALQTFVYYNPIWFQAIKGATAVHSGIMTLPMVLSLVISMISAGIATKKTGYYAPWMIISSVLTPIAAGLITTYKLNTGHAMWIGYQVLMGLGYGMGAQQPSVAAQTVLSRKDVSVGAAMMMFMQTLGGSIFVSVGNNIFDTQLKKGLAAIPGVDIGNIAATGATELKKLVPVDELPQVLIAYNAALVAVFYVVVGVASVMIIGAVGMEWRSVKQGHGANGEQKEKPEVGDEEKAIEAEAEA